MPYVHCTYIYQGDKYIFHITFICDGQEDPSYDEPEIYQNRG